MATEQRRPSAPQQTSAPLAVLPRQEAPIARTPEAAAMALERVVTMGDLAQLQPEERVAYYLDTCHSLGLNPRSRPFDWLLLDNRVVLYPNKSCADQLRAIHRIRIEVSIPEASKDGSMLRCTAKATMPDGRYDESSKYVPLKGYSQQRGEYRLSGKDLANAYMKAETGAKRRVTFSIIGMAAPPQELDEVKYRTLTVDGRGNILEHPTQEQRALAENPSMARVIGEPTFEDLDGGATVFEGSPDQRPRREAPEAPRRPAGPPPSFRASEEDIRRWCGAWFVIVKDTPWDNDQSRALAVEQFTEAWPAAKRTTSLRTMFARCREEEARDFLAQWRATVGVWKEGQEREASGEPEDGSDVGLTPEAVAEEVVRQQELRDYGEVTELSDEELDDRLEAGTTRVMGRPRATESSPTRLQLVADLRQVVEQAKSAGASVDLPADLGTLSDAEVVELTAGLRTAVDAAGALA